MKDTFQTQCMMLLLIMLSCAWIFTVSFHCRRIWIFKNHPFFKYRNVYLLFITVCGSTISFHSTLVNIILKQPNLPCTVRFLMRIKWISLDFFPLLLRSFQYLVLKNTDLRKKFPKFQSNVYTTKWAMIFFVFHTSLSCSYHFSVNRGEKCYISVEFWVTIFQHLTLIFLNMLIGWKIPWKFDAYSIGKEIKLITYCWVLILAAALLVANLRKDLPSTQIAGLLAALSTFTLSVVFPVLYLKHFSSHLYRAELNGLANASDVVAQTQFAVIFNDSCATKQFHKFAEEHFIQEVSLFLHAIFRFKEQGITGCSSELLFQQYLKINEKFIHVNAPFQINISCETRRTVLKFQSDRTGFLSLSQTEIFDLYTLPFNEMEMLLRTNFPAFSVQNFASKKRRIKLSKPAMISTVSRKEHRIHPSEFIV